MSHKDVLVQFLPARETNPLQPCPYERTGNLGLKELWSSGPECPPLPMQKKKIEPSPAFRRFPVLLFLAVTMQAPALACLNHYEPNSEAIARSSSIHAQLTEHTHREKWPAREERLRKALAEGGDYRIKNDLAAALAHNRKAQEAIVLLEEVEREKPGLYFTAANLGTAYELAGDDRKALEWIRKGIELNPAAHLGTEWLHVRILEAKLALAKDSTWLQTDSVAGIVGDEDNIKISALGNRGEALSREEVKKALIYQLHERLQFVPAPNLLVGLLLVDLADLIASEPTGIGASYSVYRLAQTYLQGIPNIDDFKTKLANSAHYASRHQRRRIPQSTLATLAPFIFVGSLTAALILFLKRSIERRLSLRRA